MVKVLPLKVSFHDGVAVIAASGVGIETAIGGD